MCRSTSGATHLYARYDGNFTLAPERAMLVPVRKWLWHPHPAWPMVATAFALRVAAIMVLHSYQFPPTNDHYLFGTEMGRIGRSLAAGHGFASPLHGNTGPTAMV